MNALSARRRPIALLALLVLGHQSAGLFITNLSSGIGEIQDPSVRRLATLVQWMYATFMQHTSQLRPLLGVILLVVLIRAIRGRSIAPFLDGLGTLLCLRCVLQFLLVNMLLLAPLRDGALLLLQLVLFLPVITIAFGWLYWRIDSGARAKGRRHLRFEDDDEGATPGLFAYFHAAGQALVAFEPSAATPGTRLAKSLFLLHGVVMIDRVALTLSRAIGLASNG